LRFLKSSINPSSSGFINSEFFDDLLAQKNSTPSNYNPQLGGIVKAYPNNADYETLWTQWLLPYLSKAAYYESLEGIVININNNGAHLVDSAHGENIGISGLRMLKDKEMADLTGNRPHIINFLCKNKEKYPLWDDTDYCSECGDKEQTGRMGGFVIPSNYKNK
jgi:hypothetical protein